MNPLPTSACLLVISCDKYADLWRPFFDVFWKRWPDCPFEVFLGSNELAFDHPRVKSIRIGPDRSWAENAHRMLDAVRTDYVLIVLEDFLIRKRVESSTVVELAGYCAQRGIDCARLAPLPAPTPLPPEPLPDRTDFGEVPPGAPYRVSAQAALWRVAALRHYLVPGFSPWEFEHLGTQMSLYTDHTFVGPFSPLIDYDHGVEKGLWKPEGLAICAEAGAAVDLNRRPAFTEDMLQAHYDRSRPASMAAAIKGAAMNAFRAGHRRQGVAHSVRYAREGGVSPELLVIVVFGLASRHGIDWLHRQHLRLKLWRIRRRARAAAALRERTARCAE